VATPSCFATAPTANDLATLVIVGPKLGLHNLRARGRIGLNKFHGQL
jgi:hypothetical protein